MDIEFTEERLRAATTATIEHIEERGNEYVADWAPLDGPRTITFDAVYRSDEPDSEVLRNNRNSGIYLILERDANRAYVGLAKNFGNRFFNGNPNHPVGCQDCRCHGHITATLETCTSHNIINSDRGFAVYILSVIPYSGNSISQAEIEWYYILREHGYEMVNADWMLGKKGYIGRPIISYDIENQKYHFFSSISEAANTLYGPRANPGWINVTLISEPQNQNRGYTHRYSTLEEVREYTEGVNVGNMVSGFYSSDIWTRGKNGPEVDLATSCKGCSDSSKKHNKRLFSLRWSSGALSAISCEHLLRTGQGTYGKSDWPKKKGVSTLRSRKDPNFKPRYQVRWKSPKKPRMPHQTNKPIWTRRKLLDATIWRERKILDNNLEKWNQRKYGSNAKWINFRQPWRFLVRNHFTDWEDGETGLSRVLTIYGCILSLVTAMVLLLIAWI